MSGVDKWKELLKQQQIKHKGKNGHHILHSHNITSWGADHRSRQLRNTAINLWTPYLRQRRQEYTMEKRQPL